MTIYTPDSLVTQEELKSNRDAIWPILIASLTEAARSYVTNYSLDMLDEDTLKAFSDKARIADEQEHLDTLLSEASDSKLAPRPGEPDTEFVYLDDVLEHLYSSIIYHASETWNLLNSIISEVNDASLPLWYAKVAETHPHMEFFRNTLRDTYGVFRRVDDRDTSALKRLYTDIASAPDVADARKILHTRFSGGGTAEIVAAKLHPLLSK